MKKTNIKWEAITETSFFDNETMSLLTEPQKDYAKFLADRAAINKELADGKKLMEETISKATFEYSKLSADIQERRAKLYRAYEDLKAARRAAKRQAKIENIATIAHEIDESETDEQHSDEAAA